MSGLQIGRGPSGRLRSGAYGHRHRRTLHLPGDAVNLAARLMSAAPPGAAYVAAEVARAAGAGFEFVRARRPQGERQVHSRSRSAARWAPPGGVAPPARGPPVPCSGGPASSSCCSGSAPGHGAGSGQVVGVVAEAGMGKSRLADELPCGRLGGGRRAVCSGSRLGGRIGGELPGLRGDLPGPVRQ